MKRIFFALMIFSVLMFPAWCFSYPLQSYYKGGFPVVFTGYYLGGNVGWQWAEYSTSIETDGFPTATEFVPQQAFKFDTNQNAFTAGGQVGYNYQSRHFLMGLELDWNTMGIGNEKAVPLDFVSPVFMPDDSFSTNLHWQSSYRLRLGYVQNNWLFYGTFGLSQINVEAEAEFVPLALGDISTSASEKKTLTGGTLGIGTECALTRHWSVGLEYRYSRYPSTNFDLGELTVSDSPNIATEVSGKMGDFSTNQVLAKVNFRVYA